MGRFDKHELPFDKYKNYLIDYLHMQGIEVQIGQVYSCPWHNDSTPSFSVFMGDDGTPAFNCFGCGRAGDIYKAVEYCTGETDAKKQFEEIDRIFGGGEAMRLATLPRPAYAEKNDEPAFTPDPAAFARFTDWLKNQPKADEYILGYFAQRAQIKSEGYIHQYPQEILRRLVTYFYWYPGKKAAEEALGKPALFAAGVPYAKKDENLPLEQRKVAWWHSGVLAKSPEGYKLLFMDGIESKKINPRAGVSYFPVPAELPEGKPVVLLEGEIDAILCQASGIENAFSMGGKGGLTKARIQKYIIPKNIPEIILFADNDKDGGSQKKFGLQAITADDHIRETVPENLIKMGYTGNIRVTVLPDDCGFKDPDDAIRNGRLDLVQAAIANATDYVAPEKPAKPAAKGKKTREEITYTEWDNVPLKFFRSFLKKIKYDDLQADEVTPFLSGASKACKDEGATTDLITWTRGNLSADDIKEAAKTDATPFVLLTIAERHGVSKYIIDRMEEILVPASEILHMIDPIPTILPIDYEKMADSKDFQAFLHFCDHAFAAYTIAKALKNNLLYIDTEEANYVFTGNYWVRIPSIATEAHAVLTNALLCYLKKYPKEKKAVLECLQKIGSNSFRQKLSNDLNKKEDQFYHDEDKSPILFDSTNIKETLTLKDGVLDFSGKELKFRKGTPDEYRLTPLPYTVKDIRSAGTPDFFLKYLNLDFAEPSEDTLKKNPVRTIDTLLYYLSLIPSRNVSKNYSCFMIGVGGTGKSTLLSAIEDIFTTRQCAQLKAQVLVAQKKTFDNENGPSPEIAELEGKLVSITMETPEDGKLNSDQLKRLTGNDLISARKLHQGLHKFRMTAQMVIATNNPPSFYKHDSGVIRRLLVFNFNVKHAEESKLHPERYKDISLEPHDKIIAEAPAIIKYLAEKYIELKHKHKMEIPVSQECENAKSQYVESQSKDTDKFYEACIQFTPNIDQSFIFARDMYKCYLNFCGYQEGSSEALNQRKFIYYLKKDHAELQGSNYTQKRRQGEQTNPEWGFKFVSFTETGLSFLNSTNDTELPFTPRHPQPSAQTTPVSSPPAPEDNPFDDAPPLTDEDGNEIDIF